MFVARCSSVPAEIYKPMHPDSAIEYRVMASRKALAVAVFLRRWVLCFIAGSVCIRAIGMASRVSVLIRSLPTLPSCSARFPGNRPSLRRGAAAAWSPRGLLHGPRQQQFRPYSMLQIVAPQGERLSKSLGTMRSAASSALTSQKSFSDHRDLLNISQLAIP